MTTESKGVAEQNTINKSWFAVPVVCLLLLVVFLQAGDTNADNQESNRLLILFNDKSPEHTDHFTSATAVFLNRLLKLSKNNDVVNLERYSTSRERHEVAQKLWQLNPDLNVVTTDLRIQDQQFILTAEIIKGKQGTFKKAFSSDRLSDVLLQVVEWINLENSQKPLDDVLKSLFPQNVYLIESYMRGLAEAQNGNQSKAIEFFNIALNENSYFYLARLELAKSYSKKGDYESSQAELETLQSFDLEQQMLTEVEVALASLELRKGEYAKGLELYNKLVEKYPFEPKFYVIHMNKMLADSFVGNIDEALQGLLKLDEVMDSNVYPSISAVTKVNIGRIYKNQQQLSLSEPYLLQSIQLFEQINDLQRQGMAYGLLGHYHLINGEYDLAISAYDQELQIAKVQNNERSVITAYSSLVELKVLQGMYDEAAQINQLMKDGAIKIGAPYLEMQAAQWAGVIALEKNQIQKATIHIDEMEKLVNELGASQPLLYGVHIMRLNLALKSKQFVEAEKFIQLLDKIDGVSVAQSYITPLKAEYLAETINSERAITYLLKLKSLIIEQNNVSQLPMLETLIAEQYLMTAPEEAIKLLSEVKVDDSNVFPYHWIMAQAYNQTGQFEKALLELNKAKPKYNQRWTLEMQQLLNELAEKV